MAQRGTKRGQSHHRSRLGRGVVALVVIGLLCAGAMYAPVLRDVGQQWLGDQGSRDAVVATDVLNVRTAPDTVSDILGAVPEGGTVEVLGSNRDGFVLVRFGNGTGWMAVQYLRFPGDPVASLAEEFAPEVARAADPVTVPPTAVPTYAPAPEPTTPPVPTGEHWIDIDRSNATVSLYIGDTAIESFSGKIGRDPATDGFYSTAVGTYHVYVMNEGLASTPFAKDTYLTDFVGFDPERKNGIHSPVRDADGVEKAWQNATTLGCVRLSAKDAESVFAFAEMGMRVEVHD